MVEPSTAPRPGMRHVPAREFVMGSEHFYPEERPCRRVQVDSFWIDETPVTNRQFAEFIADTGYRTLAEIPPNPADYPGLPPEAARAGSLVFVKPQQPVPVRDAARWWQFRFGACWNRPLGECSSLDGLENHPVVHIAYRDAEAYAHWAGKQLPTEAEWECAARAGSTTEYAWGDELAPDGAMLANYWQGEFPWNNRLLDGWERTSPVRSFPANAYGLYDLIGNVWEWTCDWYALPSMQHKQPGSCCVPDNLHGAREQDSYDPATPQVRIPRKVLKGGSHLCAPNYCQRYRPAARYPQAIDTSASHIGFRCVQR